MKHSKALARAKTAILNRDHDIILLRGKVDRLEGEARRHEEVDRERMARTKELAAQLERAEIHARNLVAERDRIMRLVDQFTSVTVGHPSPETRSLRKA